MDNDSDAALPTFIQGSLDLSENGDMPWSKDNGNSHLFRLFVGCVPQQLTEADLKPYMDQCGTVKDIMILRYKNSGQSRGCAFVSYGTEEEAKRAIDLLDRKVQLMGASIPMEVRFAHSHQYIQAGSGPSDNNQLFFSRAPLVASFEDIRAVFGQYGKVEDVQLFTDWKAGGVSKGCGIVTMATREDACRTLQGLNEKYIMQGAKTSLLVQWADPSLQSKKKKAAEEAHADNRMLFFAKVLRTAQEHEVRALFSKYGSVHDVNMFRPFLNASITKGCGLVTMSTHEEACCAIVALDGRYVWEGMDTAMVVKWMDVQLQKRRKENHQAVKRQRMLPDSGSKSPQMLVPSPANMQLAQDYDPNGRFPGLPLGDASPGCHPDDGKIFVSNLPRTATLDALRPLLEVHGPLLGLAMCDKACRGSAFAWYRTQQEAESAVCALHMSHALQDTSGPPAGPLVVTRAHRGVGQRGPLTPRSTELAPMHIASHARQGEASIDVPDHIRDAFSQQGMNSAVEMDGGAWLQPSASESGLPTNVGHNPLVCNAIGSVSTQSSTENHGTLASLAPGALPQASQNGDPGREPGNFGQMTLGLSLSQLESAMILPHLYNIQTYSGAYAHLSPGPDGTFVIMMSGYEWQIDTAKAMVQQLMCGK